MGEGDFTVYVSSAGPRSGMCGMDLHLSRYVFNALVVLVCIAPGGR